MKDFSLEVRSALSGGGMEKFLRKWNADPALKLRIEDTPVGISRKAMSGNGKHSLESIYADALHRKEDIPFAGIMDKKNVVREFIRGDTGCAGYWDWRAGTLISSATTRARTANARITLGHTHQQGYGAICSDAVLSADELLFSKRAIIEEIRLEGTFARYCADYCELHAMTKHALMSRYAWILSPAEEQAGVFEVGDKGLITYHPWRIVK